MADPPLPACLRVALLADTHGRLDRRIQSLVDSCDLAIHGGDIGSAQVLSQLQPRLGRVLAVFGNNDVIRKWPEEDRALLAHLPEVLEHDLPGGRLAVIHGHQCPARGRHRWLRGRFPQVRAVMYGHSHLLAVDTLEQPWVLNPGAAGYSRTFGGPSCLVLIASQEVWRVEQHRFAYPTSSRRWAHPRNPDSARRIEPPGEGRP